MCIEPTTSHVLTALTDLVNYWSDFKLHKERSLLLLDAMLLMLLYIDIITNNSNCTTVLKKFDNKKRPFYRLSWFMADLVDKAIEAYLQLVFVVPDTRRRYALHSLTNFDIATGGDDDFNANNIHGRINRLSS